MMAKEETVICKDCYDGKVDGKIFCQRCVETRTTASCDKAAIGIFGRTTKTISASPATVDETLSRPQYVAKFKIQDSTKKAKWVPGCGEIDFQHGLQLALIRKTEIPRGIGCLIYDVSKTYTHQLLTRECRLYLYRIIQRTLPGLDCCNQLTLDILDGSLTHYSHIHQQVLKTGPGEGKGKTAVIVFAKLATSACTISQFIPVLSGISFPHSKFLAVVIEFREDFVEIFSGKLSNTKANDQTEQEKILNMHCGILDYISKDPSDTHDYQLMLELNKREDFLESLVSTKSPALQYGQLLCFLLQEITLIHRPHSDSIVPFYPRSCPFSLITSMISDHMQRFTVYIPERIVFPLIDELRYMDITSKLVAHIFRYEYDSLFELVITKFEADILRQPQYKRSLQFLAEKAYGVSINVGKVTQTLRSWRRSITDVKTSPIHDTAQKTYLTKYVDLHTAGRPKIPHVCTDQDALDNLKVKFKMIADNTSCLRRLLHETVSKELPKVDSFHFLRPKTLHSYSKSHLKSETYMDFLLPKTFFTKCLSPRNVDFQVYPITRGTIDSTFQQMAQGIDHLSYEIMRFELHRFASFEKYDFLNVPNAFAFTKSGWYATGNGKETACFVCNLKFDNWTQEMNPLTVHRELSPNCPFIRGEDVHQVNVDREIPENGRERDCNALSNGVSQITLNGTINEMQASGNTDAQSLAKGRDQSDLSSGFATDSKTETCTSLFAVDQIFSATPPPRENDIHQNGCTGTSTIDTAISVDIPSRSFNGVQNDAVSNSRPNREYMARPFPDQNSINGFSYGNALLMSNENYNPYQNQNGYTNRNEYILPAPPSSLRGPRFPAYQSLNVRISSYQGFPPHVKQSPRYLAAAGLYYRGYADRCSCYWCGIGLQNWSDEDDPWVEHARWSPRCQYVIDQKGQDFIELVQEALRQEDPFYHPPTPDIRQTIITELQEMGFAVENIQSAIKLVESNGENLNLQNVANAILENSFRKPPEIAPSNDTPTTNMSEMAAASHDEEKSPENDPANVSDDRSRSVSMYEETVAMKEQLTCKVCMDKKVSTVFLPCGHIVACENCSIRLSKCPICRKFIREKVRTLMN